MSSKYIQFDKQLRTGTYGDSADFHSVPIGFTEFCNTRNEGVMIGGSPLHQYRFHCLRPSKPSKQLHYPFHGTHPVFRACFPHIFPPSADTLVNTIGGRALSPLLLRHLLRSTPPNNSQPYLKLLRPLRFRMTMLALPSDEPIHTSYPMQDIQE